MTKRIRPSGAYSIETLLKAQKRRQDILDFLHQHPGSDMDAVLAGTGYPLENVRGAFANMLHRHEIAASGGARKCVYFALAQTTHSAESVRAAKNERNKISNANKPSEYSNRARTRKRLTEAERRQREAEKKAAAEPWRTVHIVRHNDPPIPNQGGQGALRRDVFVNCEQFY